MVDANCWLEENLTPQKQISSYRFESCPDYKINFMKDNYSKRTYNCKCGNIQDEYAWQKELKLLKFKCSSCSCKLDYNNLQKIEVNKSAAIRTPTRNR